ncbi:MAG: phosphatase PAP2 family protein [Capnocytophaga sp.]|nr:phosphatase PAP2 family protein [Capnocytophaga sp.]
MKKILFFFTLFPFLGITQEIDSLDFSSENKDIQFYQISENETFSYKKPKIYHLVNKIPRNFLNTASDFVAKPYYPYGIASLVATGALMPADPWLINESRNLGENLGLNPNHSYQKLGPLENIPTDLNSGLYLLGNGTTFILISGGLATYGLITKDYRAQSTAMQVLESIAVTGLFVQPIKRLTGRESPFITMNDGRRHSHWNFAPSFSAYQKHTSNYDAMPSGHLTTAMAAVTVLIENYPEKKWIKPVSYTALGLLGFEMMQSKVHWASDYPIAIFMGYLIGKNIANTRITKHKTNVVETPKKYHLRFSTSILEDTQIYGINIQF